MPKTSPPRCGAARPAGAVATVVAGNGASGRNAHAVVVICAGSGSPAAQHGGVTVSQFDARRCLCMSGGVGLGGLDAAVGGDGACLPVARSVVDRVPLWHCRRVASVLCAWACLFVIGPCLRCSWGCAGRCRVARRRRDSASMVPSCRCSSVRKSGKCCGRDLRELVSPFQDTNCSCYETSTLLDSIAVGIASGRRSAAHLWRASCAC